MKPESCLPLYLALSLLPVMRPVPSCAQVPAVSPGSSTVPLSAGQLAELRRKWDRVSSADLLKAAEAEDAPAQYFYWAREWNQARNDEDVATAEMYSYWHQLNGDEQKKADHNWRAVGESDLRRAAEGGDVGAKVFWAKRKVDRALERATNVVQWLERSAQQGFPAAEYDVAIRYLGQSGWMIIDIDQPKGLAYLQRSAEHGWSPAQYELGKLYVAGELLPPDPAKAVEWLRKAADQGGPRSQYELARLYAAGIGEPRSEMDSPVALLRRAATNGYSAALQALAERYRIGLGVPADYVQAIRYYQAARRADQNAGAESELRTEDIFKLVDENLQPKPDIAPGWRSFAMVLSTYLKANQRMDPEAMNQLGELYSSGQSLPRDPVAAYFWYDRAANHGVEGAAGKRDTIKATLNSDQLKQAKNLNEPDH